MALVALKTTSTLVWVPFPFSILQYWIEKKKEKKERKRKQKKKTANLVACFFFFRFHFSFFRFFSFFSFFSYLKRIVEPFQILALLPAVILGSSIPFHSIPLHSISFLFFLPFCDLFYSSNEIKTKKEKEKRGRGREGGGEGRRKKRVNKEIIGRKKNLWFETYSKGERKKLQKGRGW